MTLTHSLPRAAPRRIYSLSLTHSLARGADCTDSAKSYGLACEPLGVDIILAGPAPPCAAHAPSCLHVSPSHASTCHLSRLFSRPQAAFAKGSTGTPLVEQKILDGGRGGRLRRCATLPACRAWGGGVRL